LTSSAYKTAGGAVRRSFHPSSTGRGDSRSDDAAKAHRPKTEEYDYVVKTLSDRLRTYRIEPICTKNNLYLYPRADQQYQPHHAGMARIADIGN
jgi:hypothetical protein